MWRRMLFFVYDCMNVESEFDMSIYMETKQGDFPCFCSNRKECITCALDVRLTDTYSVVYPSWFKKFSYIFLMEKD